MNKQSMNKKGFRHRIADFLGSYRGKTIFNFFYGFGASLAILGTMFKLLHLDGANIMLAVGLSTEVLIFALSAFEPPFRTYRWDEVFPVLRTRNPEDRPNFSGAGPVYSGNPQPAPSTPGNWSQVTPGQAVQSYGIPPQIQLSDDDAQTLSESIKRMGEAVHQLNNMTEITRVTEKYLAQLSDMADNLNRFGSATASLTEVSNVLLDSYKSITDNSSDISSNSRGYVEQMGTLNKNLSGLNTIYEIQLKSISSQIDTIDRVNNGLLHIRNMYEGSMEDSVRFKKETEAMAENLANLNRVYTRMLEAMTPGNGMNGGFPTGR
ncbi:MAG: gliding motility protein GldL [Bacteroidales bacterium]|jgi:gliding motility-associated protein GldL|nr:gliding motility protein GldL [Bacteroidales bacterium]MDD3166490.1 gliding motility protein GldL [Bacteroidales bacterium]MDD4770507.1 gliding motility protein GldL [Bacteroidales bacterium]